MKLATDLLKKFISENVPEFVYNFDDEDSTPKITSKNPNVWSRLYKSKMSGALIKCGCESIDDFLEMCDEDQIFDEEEISEICIVRHFIVRDLTLDCTVISDPKDERILRCLWHQD